MDAFWATINVPAVGGWILLATFVSIVFRALVTGSLITRREADGIKEENVRLRGSNDRLVEQGDKFVAALEHSNKNFDALRRAAEERRRT